MTLPSVEGINEQEQLTSTSTYENSNWKITSTNDNQSTNQQQTTQSQSSSQSELEHPQRTRSIHEHEREYITQQLSAEERKRERTLFIGIRDETQLSVYEHETKHLFTSSHFRQFQHMKRQLNYPHRNYDKNVHQCYHHK
ncbi:unnamed protein product [Rotaria sordida]|uniref:Uncharacterized protein n=2 Tax=Rotaria sordida TaxID=392033 RepID=A0A815QA96_9BILA|nr:unnamed protein product [Rotaria sordida]CAF3996432.1 unnamed protein product [Rotaria sordida]